MAHWKKRETLFSEYGCSIRLDGHWQLRAGNAEMRWIYRSAERDEQVTISRIEEIDSGDRATQVRHAVFRGRKALELSFGREPEFVLSEPSYTDEEPKPWDAEDYDWADYSWEDEEAADMQRPAARYHGSTAGGEHLFHVAFFIYGNIGWQIFYEAFRVPEERAAARFEELLKTVSFEAA